MRLFKKLLESITRPRRDRGAVGDGQWTEADQDTWSRFLGTQTGQRLQGMMGMYCQGQLEQAVKQRGHTEYANGQACGYRACWDTAMCLGTVLFQKEAAEEEPDTKARRYDIGA